MTEPQDGQSPAGERGARSCGTLAENAVRTAQATVRRLPLPDPKRPPPLEFHPAPAPGVEGRGHVAGGWEPGPAEPSGPFRLGPFRLATKAPTLRQALRALATGTATTRQLVEEAIEAAAATSHLGAVVALDEAAARSSADALDSERRAGRLRGPLHGAPLTVKDIMDVAGMPTRAGSRAYDELPQVDAPAVARLREAGALVLAKVATHEFALGVVTPQCRNPHDLSRIAGGSSGGSAIAVATGIGLASVGTDTRASLRVPAALCGVVGFKPTFGTVPTGGIVPLSWTVDHVGPITRDIADAALLFAVLSGQGARIDALAFGAQGATGPLPVVGFVEAVVADAEPAVSSACEAALGLLAKSGCPVVGLGAPGLDDLELSNDIGLLVTRGEAAAYHRGRGTDTSLCIPEVRDQLEAALQIPAADYLDAQRQRALLAKRVEAAFASCDIAASPTTPMVAPPRQGYESHLLRLSRNTIVWSLCGCPAVSLPVGAGADGMPIGLQLAARPGDENVLLATARLVERGLESA